MWLFDYKAITRAYHIDKNVTLEKRKVTPK